MSTAAGSAGFMCKLKDRKEVAEGTMADPDVMLPMQPRISQLCKMGLHGFYLDAMMSA